MPSFAFVKLSHEISALLKLALPVALSQLAIIGMGTTDTILAGHAGMLELAGLSLGNNVWTMVILFSLVSGLLPRHWLVAILVLVTIRHCAASCTNRYG